MEMVSTLLQGSRLVALAQPNGISVSKPVYEFVHTKTDLTFNDLGVQQVKENKFHIYDVLLDSSHKRKISKPLSSKLPMVAAAITIVVLVGGGLFYKLSVENNNNGASDFAYELPTKPSIAVMPFANLSGDEGK